MGLISSFMGGGSPSTQLLSLGMGTLYDNFIAKNITTFEGFHMAILDIFNTINAALPGKHYDAPSQADIEAYFTKWKEAESLDKKQGFVDFMTTHITPSKLDDYTLIAGVVTPPVAMVAKRAGENIPQLNFFKVVPDVVFVPTTTMLALMSVKVSRKMLLKKMVHNANTESKNHIGNKID